MTTMGETVRNGVDTSVLFATLDAIKQQPGLPERFGRGGVDSLHDLLVASTRLASLGRGHSRVHWSAS